MIPSPTGLANSDRFQWRIPPGTRPTTDARIRLSLTAGSETVTATTPGSCVILGGSLLFADGFESGNASAWSVQVP